MSTHTRLNSAVSGQGPVLILLHGLFGMGQNLSMIARAMTDCFEVHALDLRNHGRSPRADSMTFTDMAADVEAYMDSCGIEQASLLGHSLGGKVAMQVALQAPTRVNRVVVADIAPVAYSGHHDEVFAGINAVNLAALSSRKEADVILRQHIEEEGVRQFILMNLQRNEQGQFDWLLNVAGLQRCYDDLRAGLSSAQPFTGPVLFIKGELSSYIQAKFRDDILALFPAAQFETIDNTSHWLHAEQPAVFNAMAKQFLLAGQ